MIDQIPDPKEMTALLGQPLYEIWNKLCALVDEKYEMECVWNKGGKAWTYEYKYRRGGKTLCALYAKENRIGFLIILGKNERSKFDANRNGFSKEVQDVYDETKTYHDGKWLMFEPTDITLFGDFIQLLEIKRKPNRKSEQSNSKPRLEVLEKYSNTVNDSSSVSSLSHPSGEHS